MRQTTSFNSYLTKILIIAALFFTLPIVISFSGDLPTTPSYIRSVLCFFVLTWVGVSLLLGKKYVSFYLVAFGVQIVIGLIHYLVFIDPNYFSSTGEPTDSLWHEFVSVYDSLDRMISDRKSHGVLYFDSNSWQVSHPEIWKIISLPTTFLGHKWMNYAPINTFALLLTSANIVLLFNTKYNISVKDRNGIERLLLISTAYFPLFLLNDELWRDPFGIMLISIAIVLVTFSVSPISKIVSFVFFSIFSFMQRTIYLLLVGASAFIKEIEIKKKGARVILIPVLSIVFVYLLQILNFEETVVVSNGYVNQMSFLALPVKIIFGLIGPFPWWAFPDLAKSNPAFSYQLTQYLLGVFQVGYLFAIIANFKNISFRKFDYITLMGFGIMLSGFMTKQLHIGYIAEGLLFTLPWFFSQVGSKFNKYFLLSFVSLVILNILTIILGTSGITSFFR